MHTSNTTNDSIDNLADQLDDVHTPTIGSQDLDLDSTLMDAMNGNNCIYFLHNLNLFHEDHFAVVVCRPVQLTNL